MQLEKMDISGKMSGKEKRKWEKFTRMKKNGRDLIR